MPAATTLKPKPDRLVSAAEFADLVGIGERAVRELARKGIVPRTPEGLYPLRASVLGYCASMRAAATGRLGELDGSTSGLTIQRKRLVREQADRAELVNQQMRGELVPAAEVEAEWARIATALRARLLALPSRVHQRLAHLTPAELATIDREVRDALTELGTGDRASDMAVPATQSVA